MLHRPQRSSQMDGSAQALKSVKYSMHPLDNPIWKALTTSQAHFARTGKFARRFPNDVTTLAGFPEPTQEGYDSLASILDDANATGVFDVSPPQPPPGWTILAGARFSN